MASDKLSKVASELNLENRNSVLLNQQRPNRALKLSRKKQEIEGTEKTKNIQQEIWQIHTDVQEQMLRLRSIPVSVIPDSAKIVGEKLYLTADENNKTDTIIEEIATAFNISSDSIDIDAGYFLADTNDAQNVDFEINTDFHV
jgi:hypothetical protein